MKIRTKEDNRQLRDGELQVESVRGAVSAYMQGEDCVISTVRGLLGRSAQIAVLDKEALSKFIEILQELRDKM
jgi:hypothetical protein